MHTSDSLLIAANGLAKQFPGAEARISVLDGVDFHLRAGESVSIRGESGSGKSTLLRLLSGNSRTTAGTITIGGWQLPKEVAAVRAQIGMVSHKSLLYDSLTARENLLFFARLYDLPPKTMRGRIDALLVQVGLEKRGDDLVRTYSRGMQQRLSIARALLHDPYILLFDEPYTGLDQNAANTLDGLLLDARQGTQTIIMATHQLERAGRLADRVVILSRGKVGYDAPTEGMDTLGLASTYAEITGMATAR